MPLSSLHLIKDNPQRIDKAKCRQAWQYRRTCYRTPFKKITAIIQLKKNKMKNSDTPQNSPQDQKNFQNPDTHPQSTDDNSNPYDSENLDQESDSASKDITEKDIEKDLIDNDPSQGFETDIDTQNSDEAQSDTFETIEPEEDNPVKKEFEIGQLGLEELKEDELTRDATDGGAPGHDKPSQRKF